MGHYFPDKAVKDIGEWCYSHVLKTKTVSDYEYSEAGRDFLDQGAWRKFDQKAFGVEANIADMTKVMDDGFYYVPNRCQAVDSECQLQLWLHGGSMDTQIFGPIVGPYAAANDIIVIFPQAVGSWESVGTIGSDPSTDTQYTQRGDVMRFLKELMVKASKPKDSTFTAELARGEHVYGTGNGFVPGSGGKDKDGKSKDKYDKKEWPDKIVNDKSSMTDYSKYWDDSWGDKSNWMDFTTKKDKNVYSKDWADAWKTDGKWDKGDFEKKNFMI